MKMSNLLMRCFAAFVLAAGCFRTVAADQTWVVYDPPAGKAIGKHVVLISGDEEYRSEEALPMLGKILSQRHGFKCTVLFSVDPDGTPRGVLFLEDAIEVLVGEIHDATTT